MPLRFIFIGAFSHFFFSTIGHTFIFIHATVQNSQRIYFIFPECLQQANSMSKMSVRQRKIDASANKILIFCWFLDSGMHDDEYMSNDKKSRITCVIPHTIRPLFLIFCIFLIALKTIMPLKHHKQHSNIRFQFHRTFLRLLFLQKPSLTAICLKPLSWMLLPLRQYDFHQKL